MLKRQTSRYAIALLAGSMTAAACGSSTAPKAAPPVAQKPTTTTLPGRCDWEFNTVSYWSQNPPTKAPKHAMRMGNSHGPQSWEPITDTAKCAAMRTQIATMNGVMEKFPTAQDALNYGCYRATVYVAGIAAHYVCLKNITATPDAEKPLMLLYGGSEPTAPIVGLSYMMVVGGSPNKQANAPLWAQYMPWHFHEGLCTDKAGLVIGGDHTTKADCEARGGKVGGRTGWMGHYWPKSCPSPDGAFSADNPRLDWNVGSYNDDPKRAKQTAKLLRAPCAGSKMTIDAAGSDSYAKPSGMSNRAQIDTAATPSGRDMQHSSAAHDTPTSKP